MPLHHAMMIEDGMHDDLMDHDEYISCDENDDDDDDDEDDVSLDSFDNEPFEDIMMRRLGTNDPSLTTLRVGLGSHQPPNNDWGSFGRAIGMNTQLTKLTLLNGLPTSEHQLASFFSGLAVNRSIKTLTFDCTQLDAYMAEQMAPFLADNQVFQCLKVYLHDRMDIKTILLGVTSFLLMFDSLTEFNLSNAGNVNDFDEIIEALTVHAGLRKLVLNGITIGRRGYNSLVKLLNKSTKLKELCLDNIWGLTDDGWQSIFTALQSTRSKLESIEMRGVRRLNERNALCLSDALLRGFESQHPTSARS
jgi:hypothetical protein